MIQNIIIFVILIACAIYIGRRLYTGLHSPDKGCGCSSNCSNCGPDISSNCQPDSTDSDPK